MSERLVSQDGMHDVPYDRVALAVRKTSKITYAICADVIGDEYVIMGEYDSLEKCMKVLADVREQYQYSLEIYIRFPKNDHVEV